jgi:hypothetical protein
MVHRVIVVVALHLGLITTFRSVAAGRAELLIGFIGEYLVPVLIWLLVRNRVRQENEERAKA